MISRGERRIEATTTRGVTSKRYTLPNTNTNSNTTTAPCVSQTQKKSVSDSGAPGFRERECELSTRVE